MIGKTEVLVNEKWQDILKYFFGRSERSCRKSN